MPLVTVAIPTYNRSEWLRRSIASILCQSYQDYEVLIVDNCSQDETGHVVRSLDDPRIVFCANQRNIGMIRNWNRCVRLAKGKYVLILGDDDVLRPEFLEASVAVHEAQKDLGFTFSHCYKVNPDGEIIMPWGYFHFGDGRISGLNYILESANQGCCLTNSSTVMIRRSVLDHIGLFAAQVTRNTFDFNMWLRIAGNYDTYFIDRFLVDYTLHPGQISELHWRGEIPTGRIGARLEIVNSLVHLVDREGVDRRQLAALLRENSRELAELLTKTIPNL